MDDNTLLIAFMVVVVVGALFFAFLEPTLSGDAKAEKRKKALQVSARKQSDKGSDPVSRRKQVADSLKELDARAKAKKLTLDQKLKQTGLSIDKPKFFMMQAACAVVFGLVLYFVTDEILYALPGLLIGGFGIPNWTISFLRKRRINKFVAEFPNAVDVIVRGIKAGLPLNDCIRIIASEAKEPVRSEFRSVVEAQVLGLTASEAIERIAENIPTAEANFFTIVISIQQSSGGNLSEALAGLSKVLRDRAKMRLKIKAMSSEAKASAGIIGALPFAVTLLVYISSPRYIELLWLTSTGRMMLGIAGFWMFIGVMTMKKMIAFDF